MNFRAEPPVRPTTVQHLALRFGRRGLILVGIGLAWTLYGIAIVSRPRNERFSRPGPSPLDILDSRGWAILWMACGVIAFFIGIRRRFAPDKYGYVAAILPAVLWAFFFMYSWIVFLATGGEFGEPYTWSSAVVWIDVAFIVRVCAGWDDPTDPLLIPEEERPARLSYLPWRRTRRNDNEA